MKWFRNLRMGVKLVSSFLVVAIIAGIIGLVGYIGIGNVEDDVKEIGKVRLPSIQSLLIVSEGQTAIRVLERTLLDNELTLEKREEIYSRFDEVFARANEAWDIYAPLPQTKEESEEWERFISLWEEWKTDVYNLVNLSKERDKYVEQDLEYDQLHNEMSKLSFGKN